MIKNTVLAIFFYILKQKNPLMRIFFVLMLIALFF